MTLLDLRPRPDAPNPAIEAEFALLGMAMVDNACLSLVDDLKSEHFCEGAHGRIWSAIQGLAARGIGADPVTVAGALPSDPGLESLGGIRFLLDLYDQAPPASAAPDYASTIMDAARRRRLGEIAAWAQSQLSRGADTAETIECIEADLLAMQRSSQRARVVSADDAVRAMLGDLNAAEEDAGGVLTGIAQMDEHLGRLQPDELILVAGRPGAGKSALAACIALNMARSGLGVIEINSEMSVAQMMRRHVSDLCHSRFGSTAPTYKDIKRRQLKAQQWQMVEWAAKEIAPLPLALVKKTGLTLSALRSLVRRQTVEWAAKGIALGAITVDHVGLLQADGGGRDRYTDQTQIAIGMKALADELHVPVIALVQLSRKVEDRDNRRPQLSDLRDSGAWEENADVAIGVYREAYYAQKQQEPKKDAEWQEWSRARSSRTVEAILMKVREGEEGTIKLWASIGHNAIRSDDPEGESML